MLFSVFIVCAVAALAIATLLLITRVSTSGLPPWPLGLLAALVVYFGAGWLASEVWALPG